MSAYFNSPCYRLTSTGRKFITGERKWPDKYVGVTSE